MRNMRSAARVAVNENLDCYENLANAIILQAVKDYKKALHHLENNPKNRDALHEKARLERFFRSQWYGVLTELDPERLMAGVKERVRHEAIESRKKKAEKLRRKAEREMKNLLRLLLDAGAVFVPEKIARLKMN